MKSPKYLILSAAILGLASSASAANVFTAATPGSANWNANSTWALGAPPTPGVDSAYHDGGVSLEINSSVSALNYVQYAVGTQMTVLSGGTLSTGQSLIANGTATINSGGAINGTDYSFVGNNGESANVTLNGTWTNSQMFMGGFEGDNSVSSLTIGNGGSYSSAGQFAFSGGDNTAFNLTVETGGYFQSSSLKLAHINNPSGTNRSVAINVNGGDMVLTAGDVFTTVQNADGSLVYDALNPANIPDWANIVYDGGSILFTGVNTGSDPGVIASFTGVVNGWVDNGFLTSNNFTDQQLKDGFSVTDSGAVLAVPEPAAAGLVLALISGLAVVTRRRR